jgi:hypothetical protein
MMKSKILVVGLIALLMAGGLVLAGCDALLGKCTKEGKCEYRMAILSGLSAGPGVDNVCSDSDCNVYKQKFSGGATASATCNCSH